MPIRDFVRGDKYVVTFELTEEEAKLFEEHIRGNITLDCKYFPVGDTDEQSRNA